MNVQWTSKALSDLVRLHEFLTTVNKPTATRVVRSLTIAAAGLAVHPRIGGILEEFEPREVRRIFVGQYEMRYEIVGSSIYVTRLWHTREQR